MDSFEEFERNKYKFDASIRDAAKDFECNKYKFLALRRGKVDALKCTNKYQVIALLKNVPSEWAFSFYNKYQIMALDLVNIEEAQRCNTGEQLFELEKRITGEEAVQQEVEVVENTIAGECALPEEATH